MLPVYWGLSALGDTGTGREKREVMTEAVRAGPG